MRCHLLFAALAALLCASAFADEAADRRAFDALRARVEAPGFEPNATLGEYLEFCRRDPPLDPWVGVEVSARMDELQYAHTKRLDAALQAFDTTIGQYAHHACVVVALNGKARLLLAEERPGDVEAVYQDRWEQVSTTRPEAAATAIWLWCRALDQQGKKDDVIALLRRTLAGLSRMMDAWQQGPTKDVPGDWMYTRLQDLLLEAGRADEAVQWARQRFAVCSFQRVHVERAASMFAAALRAKDPAGKLSASFSEAQMDPTKPIPLDAAAVRPVDLDLTRTQLASLTSNSASVTRNRVTLLLVAGDLASAMVEARRLMLREPGQASGANEVCRVFKAADLNLHRGNAFIQYLKQGKGENPLEAFFHEQEMKPAEEGRAGLLPAPGEEERVRLTDARPNAAAGAPSPVAVEVAAAPFGAESAQTAVLLGLATGKLSPQEAIRDGGLTVEVVVDSLERTWDRKVGLALAEVVARAYPGRLDADPPLNTQARTWLSEYFCAQRDPRAAGLCEGLLAEMKEKVNARVPVLVNLARYYEAAGEWQKAVETFLRADQYSSLPSTLGVHYHVAGRVCLQNGDVKRAFVLYAKVPQYGYGWQTGLAYPDEAGWLMGQGKHKEARELLQRPVTGQYADDIRLAILSALAHSYDQTGHLDEARKCAEELLTRYRALGRPRPNMGLEGLPATAERLIASIDRWPTTPLECRPPVVVIPAQQHGPAVTRTILVRAHHAVPLTIASSDPRVKAAMVGEWVQGGNGDVWSARVEVTVPTAALEEGLRRVVTVSSPEHPGHTVQVEVRAVVVAPPEAGP